MSRQIHFRVSCLVITFQREFLLSVPSEQLITSLVTGPNTAQLYSAQYNGNPAQWQTTCAKLLFSKCPSPALLSFAYINKG